MLKHYLSLISIFAVVFFAALISYGAQDEKTIRTDVWFVAMDSQLTKTCDNLEDSPFCFVESQEVCEQFMPLAVESCKNKYRYEMPDRVTKPERREWSSKLGRCIVEELILATGSTNIDINKRCK